MNLLQTERLSLRKLNLADAPFILTLVNDPSWLENIGDKNVHSIADAERYLSEGPLNSYQVNGFGLYLAELKLKKQPVGLCGLVKREGLDAPDIGYAILPDFWGAGLATEAAKAVLEQAQTELGIAQIYGVTALSNASSIRVLEKIGLRYDKEIMLPNMDKPSRLFRLKP